MPNAPSDVRLPERTSSGVVSIARGPVEVYVAINGDASGPGRARFLASLADGDALCLPVSRAEDEARFVVRAPGAPNARARGRRAAPDQIREQQFQRWIVQLSRAPLRGPAPRQVQELDAEFDGTISAGTVIAPSGKLTWIRFVEGTGYQHGRRSPAALIETGPWPLIPHSWIQVATDSKVEVLCWADLSPDERISALTDYARVTLRLLAQDARVRESVEIRRIDQRALADRTLLDASCRELASVLRDEAPHVLGSDALELAVARVAADCGIRFHPPQRGNERRPMVRIRAMARTNGFRLRRVALRGVWWREEGRPMLASWTMHPDEGPRPVAIRSASSALSSSRFVVWDPTDGSEQVVDEQTASMFAPFAYELHAPMPEEPWRIRALLGVGFRGCRRDAVVFLSLGLVAGGLAAATPILTGKVYDFAIPEASRSQLVQIVALLLSLTVVSFLLQFVRAMAVLRAESRIDGSIQSGLWDHLLRLPARFFRDYTAGDLAMRAGGIGPMRQALSGALTGALLTGIYAIWYAGLMLYYDSRMAGWAIGALFVLASGSVGLAALQLRHQRRTALIQTRLSGLVLQLITGLSKLRVAGAEVRAFSRWARGFAEQRRSYVSARRAGNLLATLQASAPILLLALVYGLMVGEEGAILTTGEFLAFQTALLSLSGAVTSITAVFAAGAQAIPFFEQARPILECRPESDAQKADPGELTGDVEIRHVTFAYSDQTPPVLDDVSLHIRPGTFVALVGPSGSGKSSLLRLLLGFEAPQSGSIYFDGQDIAGLDLHALRRQFGVVLQEAGILAGDLFTNIVGASDASLEDAWEAARIAGLADDIRAMPMGMHTVVDQNGTTISGGQRQRLMIARAIVSRPRILLLDEATSALDNVTQQHVSNGLSALQATRIVVAHRLSTVIDADLICVFDRGRIVEQGTFSSLLQEQGLFHRLVERQLVHGPELEA